MNYELVSLRDQDVEKIRLWRNDQIEVLRQNQPIQREEQEEYYKRVILPSTQEKQPKQILFSYLLHNECIGYGGLTNIDWHSKRAEISFLLDSVRAKDPRLYEKEFVYFLDLLTTLAFAQYNFHRLYTETFEFRYHHLNILEEFGFSKEGILRDHVFKNGRWHNSILHGLLKGEI